LLLGYRRKNCLLNHHHGRRLLGKSLAGGWRKLKKGPIFVTSEGRLH